MSGDAMGHERGPQGISVLCDDVLCHILCGVRPDGRDFYVPLEWRWTAALVCRGWHAIMQTTQTLVVVKTRKTTDAPAKEAARGSVVYASSVARLLRRLDAIEVWRALDGVVIESLPHTIAALVASGNKRHAEMALDLVHDTANDNGSDEWFDLGQHVDYGIWRAGMRDDRDAATTVWRCKGAHPTPDRSAACTLLAIAGRHAASGHTTVVKRVASLVSSDLCVEHALYVTAAADNLYGVYRLSGILDACWEDRRLSLLSHRVSAYMENMWRIVGACAANKVAFYLLTKETSDCATAPTTSANPARHRHRKTTNARQTSSPQASSPFLWQIARQCHWLGAAAKSDNADALDLCPRAELDATRLAGDLFDKALKYGSTRFCDRLLGLCLRFDGAMAMQRVSAFVARHRPCPLVLEWITRQPWHKPKDDKEVVALLTQTCRLSGECDPSTVMRLVDAIASRWPTIASAFFASGPHGVALLASCVVVDEWDLAERVLDLLERHRLYPLGRIHDAKGADAHDNLWTFFKDENRTKSVCPSLTSKRRLACLAALLERCRPDPTRRTSNRTHSRLWTRVCRPTLPLRTQSTKRVCFDGDRLGAHRAVDWLDRRDSVMRAPLP